MQPDAIISLPLWHKSKMSTYYIQVLLPRFSRRVRPHTLTFCACACNNGPRKRGRLGLETPCSRLQKPKRRNARDAAWAQCVGVCSRVYMTSPFRLPACGISGVPHTKNVDCQPPQYKSCNIGIMVFHVNLHA